MTTPHELADSRVQMAGEYARFSAQLEEILEKKATIWMSIRLNTKSDASADKHWDASEDGVKEMKLRLRMKAMEKQMSAAGTMLRVYETESRNIF